MINFAESKWYKAATVLWEMMFIGFLWTLFSLPIVTIGASTTALYYVATKKISGKDNEYIFSAFWNSFKVNFVKATIIYLILALVGFVAWFNFTLLPYVNIGGLTLPVRIILFFVLVQVIFISSYVFAIIARFETSIIGALKAANFIANRHVFITITNLVLLLGILYVMFLVPVILLFMMGVYGYFSSFGIVKLFRRHYPDFEESIELPSEEV